jgi:hypothetical protein
MTQYYSYDFEFIRSVPFRTNQPKIPSVSLPSVFADRRGLCDNRRCRCPTLAFQSAIHPLDAHFAPIQPKISSEFHSECLCGSPKPMRQPPLPMPHSCFPEWISCSFCSVRKCTRFILSGCARSLPGGSPRIYAGEGALWRSVKESRLSSRALARAMLAQGQCRASGSSTARACS